MSELIYEEDFRADLHRELEAVMRPYVGLQLNQHALAEVQAVINDLLTRLREEGSVPPAWVPRIVARVHPHDPSILVITELPDTSEG